MTPPSLRVSPRSTAEHDETALAQPASAAPASGAGGGGGTRQVSCAALAFWPPLQVAPGTAAKTDAQSAFVVQSKRELLALLPGQAGVVTVAPAAGAAGVTQAGTAPPPPPCGTQHN